MKEFFVKKVVQGHRVAVHYTGTLDSGEVFDSSEGNEPLKFTVGMGSVIDGFNNAVIGLGEGEERKVTIAPVDGYGDRDESRVMKADRASMDADFTPEVGMAIGLQMADGARIRAVITEISEDEITFDLNHPLAGKTLHFAVKVVEIREADDPEAHGWENEQHSHSCGSCGDDGCCSEGDDECCDEHDHDSEDCDDNDHGHGGCCGRHK
ncbi:MAG: peptidylprolyl isomerase [Candidatus Riflebacteria bacterium]|nr:peptidylprolyl isomerase [Candidatus Riflebacteria bacterium]